MKWLLDSYPQLFVALSILLPFLFWTYIGFAGQWKPWRNKLHIPTSNDSYIASPRGLRAIRSTLEWRQERRGWLNAGIFAVIFIMILMLAYIL